MHVFDLLKEQEFRMDRHVEKILTHFAEPRKKFSELYPKKAEVLKILEDGASRAHEVASKTLEEAKKKIGYL